MSLLVDFLGRWRRKREPSPRENLEAHIEALRDRFGPASVSHSGGPLKVVTTAGQYRVVVEAGLSRIEVHCLANDEYGLSVPCDALLAERPERARARSQRWVEFGLARDRSVHFAKVVRSPRDAIRRTADEVERLLFELFEHPTGRFYSVAIEKETVPDAAQLLESIRQLVKTKDQDSRRQVYQNVINTRFYLPLCPNEDEHALPDVHSWHEPMGQRPVWAVFTDFEALEDYRAQRDPYVVITGIRLVQAALAHRLGALKINPKSKVGGELYANELDAIGNYLRSIGLMESA